MEDSDYVITKQVEFFRYPQNQNFAFPLPTSAPSSPCKLCCIKKCKYEVGKGYYIIYISNISLLTIPGCNPPQKKNHATPHLKGEFEFS